ncbi:MAG TPA: TIR domain-containing protein [Steroidobacteraceae bacterium]
MEDNGVDAAPGTGGDAPEVRSDPNLGGAVFVSYASQDASAAERIAGALREAGIEVWFDQSELRGGDAWDASIRRQIKNCALFIALISKNTHARGEGYFRLEWKLAVDRSHLMASDVPFLLPVVVDDTPDQEDRVPDRFREVQWTRLPAGEPPSAFVDRVARMIRLEGMPALQRGLTLPGGAPSPIDTSRAPSLPNRSALESAGKSSPPRSQTRLVWIATMALVLLAAGVFMRHQVSVRAPIIPYSAEDRRMTFALLPLQGTADDPTALQVAKATGEVTFTSLDENHDWVQLAPRSAVEQAMRKFSAPRDLARALNVHFLMRGSIARASSGYELTLFVVDGATEHVLGSMSVPIPVNALVPRSNDEIDEATGYLIYYALQAEVDRARSKPDAALDVRDLAFRAFVDWGHSRMANDPKGAYVDATQLLKRALAIAPDDSLALRLTAKVNLCDCVDAWSTNVAEQQAIGEAAVDRYLLTHPEDTGMLREKASIYELRGRYQDALVILDSVLSRNPQSYAAMEERARSLLKLGRPKEALAPATTAYNRHADRSEETALLAAIYYELADYAEAARLGQQAAAEMSKPLLGNPNAGSVRLTLIAAAAHLHDDATAKSALADLAAATPALTSVTAVRKWIHPQANLYGYEPLFDGLRLAGLPE